MAHTVATRLTAYKKMKERRRLYLEKHGPCKMCGSSEKLEMHHRDPSQKVHHAVWSWAESRMLE